MDKIRKSVLIAIALVLTVGGTFAYASVSDDLPPVPEGSPDMPKAESDRNCPSSVINHEEGESTADESKTGVEERHSEVDGKPAGNGPGQGANHARSAAGCEPQMVDEEPDLHPLIEGLRDITSPADPDLSAGHTDLDLDRGSQNPNPEEDADLTKDRMGTSP
jgi:hypothetical protein